MSGICGAVNLDGAPADGALVRRMAEKTPYRGPDGQRFWQQSNAALGHLAFNITPESLRERQPVVSDDGRVVLVADVRLDNRDELIRELRLPRGPQLTAPTDADLILAAYQRWGGLCPEHLLGDWVFALWDRVKQALFLARDALGARSLCYRFEQGRCLFASEVGQLLDLPGVPVSINEGKIADFLAVLWNDHSETFFESIFYVPPGHCLTMSARGIRKRCYWEPNAEAEIRYRNDREYADHFTELLRDAVRCRMRSVAPVGLSLSGGLDSTLLAAVASEVLPDLDLPQERLKTFSYVFDDLESCDERQYIQPVVDRYGLDAAYLPCDGHWTLRDLKTWPVELDFVWADAFVRLPAEALSAAGGAGCRILLNGQYGDALFSGGCYWAADLLRARRFGEMFSALRTHGANIDFRRDVVDHGLRQLVPAGLKRAYRRLRPAAEAWRNPGMHPNLGERTHLQERAARDQRGNKVTKPGQFVRLSTLTDSSWAQAFGEGNKFHYKFGIEQASPYYDRRIVEFVLAVPADQLGRPWRSRWMQREAMTPLLPATVCERPTATNFEPLARKGLLDRERDVLEELMARTQIVSRRLVREDWLRETLAAPPDSSEGLGCLWLFVSMELWLRASAADAR